MRIYYKFKNIWPYLLTVLAITLPWFLKPGLLFFTDFVWGPRIYLDWTSNMFLSSMLVKLLSLILPLDLIQKLFISMILFVVLWGGKKITENFVKDKWLIFIGSLFALFNPFVYDRLLYGQMNIVLSSGLLLLTFGFVLEYLKSKDQRQVIWVSLGSALAVLFSPHFIFFLAVIYLLFIFLAYGKLPWPIVARNLLIVVAIILALNANWLWAYVNDSSTLRSFVNEGIARQELVAFQTSGHNAGAALTNVIMMSGFWGKDQFRYADLTKFSRNWGRSFVLLLPVMIWGIICGFKNNNYLRLVVGLIFILIISVILAAGIRAAGQLTYWLFDHVPFYKGFRETQKWVSMIVLVYIIFLALGLKKIFSQNFVLENKEVVKIILAGIIIMQAPLLLWGSRGQVVPAQYPADWYDANQKITEGLTLATGQCDGRILFLPWHLYMRFRFVGAIIANPANQFFSCPIVQGTNMEWGGIYDDRHTIEGKLVTAWLISQGHTGLEHNPALNIKYIILAKEADWLDYSWLNLNPEIVMIKETENLKIYKIK